jgi:hypothetical protein
MNIVSNTLPIDGGAHPRMNVDEAYATGEFLRDTYVNADPYPHIVMDNFLPDELIRHIHTSFPAEKLSGDKVFDINYGGHHKRQIQPEECPDDLRSIFHFFNSAPMLRFLEGLTGIEGLIPDPYYEGGGLHETSTGGKLGVHADFRINSRLACERRLNLLVYLNPEWRDEWMGQLEIWDRKMTRCVSRVNPVWNRCVVFSTDADSYHGHPDPLATPPDVKRRSMALYYYTASKAIFKEVPDRSTMYVARPGDSADIHKEARAYRVEEYLRDWLPPVGLRALYAVRRRLGR